MKTVAIISTGNELLYGNVQDYNSFYISRVLFPTHFSVILHITIGDVFEDLEHAVEDAIARADIVIITGGLGSTDDDKTLEVLQRICGFETQVHQEGYYKLEKFLRLLGRKVIPGDEKMLFVPVGATIFKNDSGFAPGFALKKNQSLLIAMPGVPREMQGMFENEVLPYLLQAFDRGCKDHCTVRTILMRESEINELIAKMKIPLSEITWGVTTTPGMNTITFVSKGDYTFDRGQIIGEAQEVFANKMLMPESINLEMELLHLLKENESTIAVAESCTGGLISKRVTDIPGSSEAFLGGLVAYSNDAKMNLLNISRNALKKYGAVSEEIAREMAVAVKERFNSTIGISTTGIAGPEGGTEKKPVGTVCFGIATPDGVDSFTESITMDRERVRFYASQYILNKVRLYLKGSQ